MAETKTPKDISDVTKIPSGLDVIPSVPGTFVGGHDVQGADGTPRTDRPGEILGTPITDTATVKHQEQARAQEEAKHDYVREAVDINNREVLPLLGGDINDQWEGKGKPKVEVPEGIVAAKDRTK